MTLVPFTAFHPIPVWLVWMRWPRRFDLVALTVGAVVPDLFEPFILLGLPGSEWMPDRDWTHSLLGASTLDSLIALAGTVLVARPILRWADRRWPGGLWSHFAGHEMLASRSWSVVLLSVWVGSVSHVLLDVPFHMTFRLFFPIGPEVLLFHWTMQPVADLVANLLFGPTFVLFLYQFWWRPSRRRMRESSVA